MESYGGFKPCFVSIYVTSWPWSVLGGAVTWGTYSGGDGSESNPYQLTCEADWRELAASPGDWDQYFVVLSHVDFGLEVMPCIGTSKLPFSGQLDGQGMSLTNLVSDGRLDADAITDAMPSDNPRRGGLFGVISGVVMDLTLVDPIISATQTGNAGALAAKVVSGQVLNCRVQGGKILGQNAGGLIGWAQDAEIEACGAESFVVAQLNTGGLIGVQQSGTINQCKASSWVVAESGHGGGLVGLGNGSCITNSYSDGVLICSNDEVILGGIVGYYSGSLINCYGNNSFLVWTLEYSGGLVGRNTTEASIWASFWNLDKSPTRRAVGGLNNYIADATTEDLQNEAFFLDQGWDLAYEGENGTEEIWFVEDGVDFPRLRWEVDDTVPVASADPDQAVKTATTTAVVTLNGSGSYDFDDDEIVQWEWTWSVEGQDYQVEGKRVQIELPLGAYLIGLRVSDGTHWSESDSVTIVVSI